MTLLDIMKSAVVIPVIAIDDPDHAVPLAKALVAGGIRVLEVTLRTKHGLDAIRAMAQVEGAIVGVGTLTQPEEFAASRDAGAVFGVSPEILAGGPLGLVRDGDIIRVDATQGTLDALVPADVWASRKMATADLSSSHIGMGRELFDMFRKSVSAAEEGAAHFPLPSPIDTTVPLHEGTDSGEIMPGSDEDFLFRKSSK